MKIIAFVPIKLNNERMPGKNIKPFANGKPLCQYLFHTLTKVDMIDKVYAFCSDRTICDYLLPGVEWLTRDVELDDNQARGIDIVERFARMVDADIYVLAHATSPFITVDSFQRGLRAVTEEGHDSSVSVIRLNEFLWYDGKPLNYDPANIPRTQDLPVTYMETSGFFIFTKDIVKKHRRRLGFNPKFIEVSNIEAVDIDYPEDFSIAEAIFNWLPHRGLD